MTFKRVEGGKLNPMQIGEAARRAGVSPPTIRYYEEIGLLPKPARSSAGYRRYTEATVEELRFIRKGQAIGFSLDEIRGILQLARSGRRPCGHVLSLAHQHLDALDEQIHRLQTFKEHLAGTLAKWEAPDRPTTCGPLCDFIANADPEIRAPEPPRLSSPGAPATRSRYG